MMLHLFITRESSFNRAIFHNFSSISSINRISNSEIAKFQKILLNERNETFLFQDKMSMTGSLMGYENNNEINQAKCKKPLKPLPIVSSINSSGITTTNKTKKPRRSARRSSCIRGHVNSLWSVWYGVLAVAFQAYIGLRYAKRFAGKSALLLFLVLFRRMVKKGGEGATVQRWRREREREKKGGNFFPAYLSLPWPADAPPPKVELYACLVLAGAGVVLLPVLLGAAFLKLGNLANDGVKLGRHLSACSRDPPSSLLTNNPDHSKYIFPLFFPLPPFISFPALKRRNAGSGGGRGGWGGGMFTRGQSRTRHDDSVGQFTGLANNLWRHGGPTAAFVHLCTAMCFLLPSLLMEARLIHAGFLPKGNDINIHRFILFAGLRLTERYNCRGVFFFFF